MKKLILMFGVVAAAFLSNADYLLWQVSQADDEAYAGKYNYATISYKINDNDPFTILEAETRESATGGTISTDLSTLTEGTTYSLFVELMNYDSQKDVWNQVGVSTTPITYTAGATSGDEHIIFSDVLPSAPSVPVWHGGSVDVPEPTSGMMVMLGFAFLALKRRKV